MKGFICVHGHFYQPPRENPWLEAIEVQDSAYPFHDWNERVTTECYAPNALARILDAELRIVRILNNYSRMSFDIGPTLLSWLESKAPEVYSAILDADRLSREQFSGHGSAIAQVYNHMIMPLANRADKATQAYWAVRDFEYRFGRAPEGMWLPETAVDVETLEILADLGIKFTILGPHQARRSRRKGETGWTAVRDGRIDTSMAYSASLPSGRAIALFFFNADISRAVAFERLLDNGENLGRRLVSALPDHGPAHLTNIATDGESYGHHHRYGEMALAFALRYIEGTSNVRLTNYGEFLERFPPTHEVEIHEKTAWSCAHGVERWRSDCGCSISHHPGWNQAWRAPLRAALDWLKGEVSQQYEQVAPEYLKDTFEAQKEYIQVILDRSPASLDAFFARNAIRTLAPEDKVMVLKLLELQRHSMLMFTSCGWFFDDISGIETIQILRYAARAIQLAGELFGVELEDRFLERLEQARSNVKEQVNGRQIYESQVKPGIADLDHVAAHYALSSLYERYPERSRLYCYSAHLSESYKKRAGKARLVAGRVEVTSNITLEAAAFTFAAIHFGDHNLTGGVRPFRSSEAWRGMTEEIGAAFDSADLLRVVRLLDRHFPNRIFSLKQLFRDEQRRIVQRILAPTLTELEESYDEIYEPNVPLMRFLEDMKSPLPRAFELAGQFILNTRLERAFQKENIDPNEIMSLLDQAKTRRISLDEAQLGFRFRQLLKRQGERLRRRAGDPTVVCAVTGMVKLADAMPFPVVKWELENAFHEVLQTRLPGYRKRADRGDETAVAWMASISELADRLRFRI